MTRLHDTEAALERRDHVRFDGPLVVLAPHPDDAVLSLGGWIGQVADASGAPTILTVFAGSPREPTSFARRYHAENGMTGDVMKRRRREEREAATVLGAALIHLSHVEALYRGAESLADVFRAPKEADNGIARSIVNDLLDCEAARAARTVAVPIGIGGHLDHVITRRAGEAFAARRGIAYRLRVLYFEDLPYAARRAECTWRHLIPPGLLPWVVTMRHKDWERKCRSIECYTSQLGILWPDGKSFQTELGAYMEWLLAGVPVERLWG